MTTNWQMEDQRRVLMCKLCGPALALLHGFHAVSFDRGFRGMGRSALPGNAGENARAPGSSNLFSSQAHNPVLHSAHYTFAVVVCAATGLEWGLNTSFPAFRS